MASPALGGWQRAYAPDSAFLIPWFVRIASLCTPSTVLILGANLTRCRACFDYWAASIFWGGHSCSPSREWLLMGASRDPRLMRVNKQLLGECICSYEPHHEMSFVHQMLVDFSAFGGRSAATLKFGGDSLQVGLHSQTTCWPACGTGPHNSVQHSLGRLEGSSRLCRSKDSAWRQSIPNVPEEHRSEVG